MADDSGEWRELGVPLPAGGVVSKRVAREAVRVLILPHLSELVAAQVAQAKGIKYLVARNIKGEFKRIADTTAEELDALLADGSTLIEVHTQNPSTPAFTDLLNRAIDKPKEQEIEVTHGVTQELFALLDAGKLRRRLTKGEE